MDKKLLEFLSKETPNSLGDIREVLELLSTTIDSAVDQIGINISNSYTNKEFEKIKELVSLTQEVDTINKKVQDVIGQIDDIVDEDEIELEENEYKEIPNYSDFLVDTEIEHNLYEDLTHKRPCAFKIENKKIEVRDWKNTLVQTIEYLGEKDKSKIIEFINDPKMNGKKVTYFAKERKKSMRSPRYIRSADIYIETNLSANGIRNLLIKVLNKFDIKLCEYKIYFKADYSELH